MSGPTPELSQPEIDARVRAWRRSLDPQALWPETTPAQRVAAYRHIWAATEAILAGRRPVLDSAGSTARATGVAAFLSGMGPLLGYWLERGVLQADPATAAVLARHLVEGRARHRIMLGHLEEALDSLSALGIEPVILKGLHTAPAYFEDPGARPSGDIDLLIRPDQMAVAARVMSAAGLVEVATHSRPERESWGSGPDMPIRSTELTHADNPWAIDLHQTLDRTYFPGLTAGLGTLDATMITTAAIGGRPVKVLAHPALAAFLALHSASDLPEIQLIRIVELILVFRRDFARDAGAWRALGDLLARTRTLRLAYPALRMADALAPGSVDAQILAAANRDATPRMRRAVGESTTALPYHLSHRSIEARMVWAKGWGQVGRNALDMVFPRSADLTTGGRLRIMARRAALLLGGRLAWRPRR